MIYTICNNWESQLKQTLSYSSSYQKEHKKISEAYYYVTNESSPIAITLNQDGTCSVVKTMPTEFSMKYFPSTTEYPETENTLNNYHTGEHYRVSASSVQTEKLEWCLNPSESRIIANLMNLQPGETQYTDSTAIQLFLDGFYKGLSGKTKIYTSGYHRQEEIISAEHYIDNLKSTDFNCGRTFIYAKEGKCENSRYPSAF